MKLPLRMLIPIAWRGMQSHRVREWRVEDLIVGRCNGLQNRREIQPPELNLATTLQRVSPLPAKLPTSAPLSAEKTRLTLNCAPSVHLEKSMGTSTSAWPPGGILFSSIGNGRSAFG